MALVAACKRCPEVKSERMSSLAMPKEPGKIAVLIADDHQLMRRSLKGIIEQEQDLMLVGEASDGEEAIRLAAELEPDVVIMDIGMPGMSGLEATQKIKELHPAIAVLALTIHSDDQSILGILQAGAAGYLTKSVLGEQVAQSIRGVASGEMVLSQEVGMRLLKYASRFPTKSIQLEGKDRLSPREIEILRLAARGMTNRDIAAEVGLSIRTVKGYLIAIFSKLHVASRTEAVTSALQMGVLSIDDLG
jgi:NarL family two-component system response regulator LiaR